MMLICRAAAMVAHFGTFLRRSGPAHGVGQANEEIGDSVLMRALQAAL
jgi:hypothetical protein